METKAMQLEQERIATREMHFFHTICSHAARGGALDELLATASLFASQLARCDQCFTYVRVGAELVPWIRSANRGETQPAVRIDRGFAAALAEHRAPIVVSQDDTGDSTVKTFEEWSTENGETFVCVPLLARSKLVGAINLQHCRPHQYSRREFNLLSSAGYLFGASILLAQLESENADLVLQLETRKLVERGKGILQRDLGLTEEEAYLSLQRQSRRTRRPMKEIAQAIILSDEVRNNSLRTE